MSHIKRVSFFYEAIKRLNQEDVALDVLKDVAWQEMEGGPYGGLYYGTNEIYQHVFKKIAVDWKQFVFQQEVLSEAGDRVFVIGTYSGESHSGKKMRSRVVHIWTFFPEQNQIKVKFEQFTDTFFLREALTSTDYESGGV